MGVVYKSLSRTSAPKAAPAEGTAKKNKQRVLILTSRGVTYRHRHLLNDIYSLLPHSRKDAKLDTKTKLYQLNELAELYNCNNVMFFEARKAKDLYIWMSKAPNGPTVKMHLQNCTRCLSTLTSLLANSARSTHNVRATFPGQLFERLPTHPLLRLDFHLTAASTRHQRDLHTCFRCSAGSSKDQTVCGPCHGFHSCRWKDMDTMFPNQ